VLNILGHCYLFPESPHETDGSFKKGLYERKQFGSISEVQKWLNDLNTFIIESKSYRAQIYFFPKIESFEALRARDSQLFKKWESSRLLKTFGHIDPDKIFNDFTANLKTIEEVANNTQSQINRMTSVEKYYPSKTMSLIFYFLVGIVFLCSVVVPMTIPNLPKYYYIHIPIAFYAGLYIYGVYKLIK